jgi:hypothetical protein
MTRVDRKMWFFFLVIRDGARCAYCNAKLRAPSMRREPGFRAANVEHLSPGDPTTENNLFLSCGPCNRAKNALRLLIEPQPRVWVDGAPMLRVVGERGLARRFPCLSK